LQVMRIIFMIGVKALLDGKLGREAARERDRQRILAEMARDLRARRPSPDPSGTGVGSPGVGAGG
jgi:hypothetical protein